MKVFKTFLIFLICVVILAGCVEKVQKSNMQEKFVIVTSFYPIYISAINVTKDIENVEVINLTAPQTGCLHDYQLKPQDIKTLENADAFVINGAGMEAFLDKIMKQQKNLKIVDASKGISSIKDPNGEVNPHIWVSVSNNILQVKNIAEQLALIDVKNSSKYHRNADVYVTKLTALKGKMTKELQNIKTRDIITFHEAFPYFAKEFNFNIAAVIEREPGTTPTPKELEEIIKIVKNSKAKVLFAEPQYSIKAAEEIVRETGAKMYTLDPAVTGVADKNAFDDYIKVMENNLKSLKEGLS